MLPKSTRKQNFSFSINLSVISERFQQQIVLKSSLKPEMSFGKRSFSLLWKLISTNHRNKISYLRALFKLPRFKLIKPFKFPVKTNNKK